MRLPENSANSADFFFHRFAPAAIMLVIVIGGFVYGSSSGNMSGEKVIVYNWGDYIDPEIITMFEDETESTLYMKNMKQMKSCTRKCSPARLLMTSSVLLTIWCKE